MNLTIPKSSSVVSQVHPNLAGFPGGQEYDLRVGGHEKTYVGLSTQNMSGQEGLRQFNETISRSGELHIVNGDEQRPLPQIPFSEERNPQLLKVTDEVIPESVMDAYIDNLKEERRQFLEKTKRMPHMMQGFSGWDSKDANCDGNSLADAYGGQVEVMKEQRNNLTFPTQRTGW